MQSIWEDEATYTHVSQISLDYVTLKKRKNNPSNLITQLKTWLSSLTTSPHI